MRSCSYTKCMLDVADRCGDDYFGPVGHFPIKGYRSMYKALCFKFSPVRGSECLNSYLKHKLHILHEKSNTVKISFKYFIKDIAFQYAKIHAVALTHHLKNNAQ